MRLILMMKKLSGLRWDRGRRADLRKSKSFGSTRFFRLAPQKETCTLKPFLSWTSFKSWSIKTSSKSSKRVSMNPLSRRMKSQKTLLESIKWSSQGSNKTQRSLRPVSESRSITHGRLEMKTVSFCAESAPKKKKTSMSSSSTPLNPWQLTESSSTSTMLWSSSSNWPSKRPSWTHLEWSDNKKR